MARKPDTTHEWGQKTAKERYGSGHGGFEAPPQQCAPQAPEDKQSPGYDNDVPLSGWLRGPDATKKPGFVKPSFKR